jgi:hypothetical protein
MSNLPRRNTRDLRPQTLPAVPTSGLPAVISMEQVSALEQDLLAFRERRAGLSNEEFKQQRAELLPRWQEVDQLASRPQIAMQAAVLVGFFPHMVRAEGKLFSRALVEHIVIERPTAYELERACRLVRKQHEFLSGKAVMEKLERAKTWTWRFQVLLDAPNKPTGMSLALLDIMHWVGSPKRPKLSKLKFDRDGCVVWGSSDND